MAGADTAVGLRSSQTIPSRAATVSGMTAEEIVTGPRSLDRTRNVSASSGQSAINSPITIAATAQRAGNIVRTATLSAIQIAARMA